MKVGRYVIVFVFYFLFYLLMSGSVKPYDILVGGIASAVLAALTADILIKRSLNASDVLRFLYLVKYFFWYFVVAETKAHYDVIKRALSPSMPIRPGIVEVPYEVSTDYGVTLIAGSITNTPGTVTVEIDKDKKRLYVHWIDVKVTDPYEVRKHISEDFEDYARIIWG